MKKTMVWIKWIAFGVLSLVIAVAVGYLVRLIIMQMNFSTFQHGLLPNAIVAGEANGVRVQQEGEEDLKLSSDNLTIIYNMLKTARPVGMSKKAPQNERVLLDFGGEYQLEFTHLEDKLLHVRYTFPDGKSGGFSLNENMDWQTLEKLVSPEGTIYSNEPWKA